LAFIMETDGVLCEVCWGQRNKGNRNISRCTKPVREMRYLALYEMSTRNTISRYLLQNTWNAIPGRYAITAGNVAEPERWSDKQFTTYTSPHAERKYCSDCFRTELTAFTNNPDNSANAPEVQRPADISNLS
jgi:hypothetical protein